MRKEGLCESNSITCEEPGKAVTEEYVNDAMLSHRQDSCSQLRPEPQCEPGQPARTTSKFYAAVMRQVKKDATESHSVKKQAR